MDLNEIALAGPSLKLADGMNERSTLDVSHGSTFTCVRHHDLDRLETSLLLTEFNDAHIGFSPGLVDRDLGHPLDPILDGIGDMGHHLDGLA